MSSATTIRAEVINYLECNGHTYSSFGQATGINKGVISAILNNNPPKPISVRQIDLITKGLGYAEGALYNLYVEECFVNEKPNGRRISAFLIRCAELGKEDCITEVLARLMENLIYVPLIFSIAEKLYMSEMEKESIIFYQCVAEHEKYQHSERLAISQYRIFRASLGLDAEHNMEAALQFISYRKRLPENYQLDALYQLLNIYYAVDKYDKVEKYADELIVLSNVLLKDEQYKRMRKRAYEPLATERLLFVYYAYGYLMKGEALECQERYEEAMKCVAAYANLTWLVGLDQEGLLIVEQYRMWAIANTCSLKVLSGNVDTIPEYAQLLRNNPNEILPGLLIIMISANRYKFSVEDILEEFKDEIVEYQKDPFSNLCNGYIDVINRVRCANLCYQVAIYQFGNRRYREGMRNALQSLTINAKINKKGEIIDSMSLFEIFRNFATQEELGEYNKIIKGGYNHEEDSSFVNLSCWSM